MNPSAEIKQNITGYKIIEEPREVTEEKQWGENYSYFHFKEQGVKDIDMSETLGRSLDHKINRNGEWD